MKMNSVKKERIIVFAILIVIISLTSVGYAASSVLLDIDNKTLVKAYIPPSGDESLLYISQHELDTGSSTISNVTYDATVLVNGNVNIRTDIEGALAYKQITFIYYTIVNESEESYTYNGATINKFITNYQSVEVGLKYPCIFGINEGDVIAPGESVRVGVLFYEDMTEEFGGAYPFTSSILFSFLPGVEQINAPSIRTELLNDEATFSSSGTAVINTRITNLHSCGYSIMYVADDENINIAFETGNDSRFIYVDKDYDEVMPFIIYTGMEYLEDVTFKILIRDGYGDYIVTREVGEVTIHPYESGSGEEEEQQLTNVTGTAVFDALGWANHARMDVTIDNQSGYDIEEWTLKVYFDPSYDLIGLSNYQFIHAVDSVNGIITIQSTGLYVSNNTPIPNGTSLNISNTIVEYLGGYVDEDGNKQSVDLEHTRLILYAKVNGNWIYNILIG